MKYSDNNVVNVATNYDSSAITHTNRYSVKKKTQISIPKPVVIVNYNTFMGGVDQMDHWVSNYRTRMRQKKWWWPIFRRSCSQFMASVEEKTENKTIPLLTFRRTLATSLLKKYGTPSTQGKHFAPYFRDVRYDGMNHLLRQCNTRRCANCPGKVAFYCIKCDVGLHPRCHEDYHTRK